MYRLAGGATFLDGPIAPRRSGSTTNGLRLVGGLQPGESAPTVMRLNEPLRTHLKKRLGIIPVELKVGANYAATGCVYLSCAGVMAQTTRQLDRTLAAERAG